MGSGFGAPQSGDECREIDIKNRLRAYFAMFCIVRAGLNGPIRAGLKGPFTAELKGPISAGLKGPALNRRGK